MTEQLNENNYFTILPSIIGEQNAYVKKILLHKTNNEAIFELTDVQQAESLCNRLVNLKNILEESSEEEELEKPLLNFSVFHIEKTHLLKIAGNIYNLFEKIIKASDVQLFSQSFILKIEKNKEIYDRINISKNYVDESQTSDEFKPIFEKSTHHDQKQETKNNSRSFCNIL